MGKSEITHYLIVDLEVTCWQSPSSFEEKEIIEIGAVMLDSKELKIETEYSCFVKPRVNPILSEFCQTLTTIRQEDINSAVYFDVAFRQFLDWVGTREFSLCSWGIYDVRQIQAECNRFDLEYPNAFANHINLKKLFAEKMGVAHKSVVQALEYLDQKFSGTHHRGIDNARNIARIAREILPLATGMDIWSYS